jgi:hypothetical protein
MGRSRQSLLVTSQLGCGNHLHGLGDLGNVLRTNDTNLHCEILQREPASQGCG